MSPTRRLDVFGAAGQQVGIEDQIFMRYEAGGEAKALHEPRFCTAGSDSLVETGFLPELQAFVAHVRGERKVEEIPSRIEEAVKSMALYEAIRRSAQTGKPERPQRFG